MKLPRFDKHIVWLAVLIAFAVLSASAFSEPPPKEGPSDSKKTALAPRVKPQVIYHLSKSSSDAAVLHAQAKAENNALPIDSNMPTSLQLARSNANAAAAQATTPTPSVHSQTTEAGDRKQHQNKSVTKTVKARSPATNHSIRTGPPKNPATKPGNKP